MCMCVYVLFFFFYLNAGTMTCLLDCLSLVSPFNSLTPSICPSDVTFTVAGGDRDGRGGCFAGQTGLGTGGVPQAVHGAILVRQGANRAAGQDLLLEPEQRKERHDNKSPSVSRIIKIIVYKYIIYTEHI